MSDRLPRSNSQTHLPNYGQGQPNENNKEVDKKKMAPLPDLNLPGIRGGQLV